MKGLSRLLKGYQGENPFHESQARTFGDDKLATEFFPTSFFWSLFNEQHEILIGTRGSGKTALLKMLSYSCLRRIKHPRAQQHVQRKSFIAFYVPLHLEFMACMPSDSVPESARLRYFHFALNCASAKSFLSEVENVLRDSKPKEKDRLVAECDIVDHLAAIWMPQKKGKISSLKDLGWEIDVMFNTVKKDEGYEEKPCVFNQTLFQPIISVLPRITEDLLLDVQKTNWLICLDEAEFLAEPFQKCLNTFLRSEKRPLVVKMATLPFKHSTRDTLVDGIRIEPNGNDFNYRVVDAHIDSDDFRGLCDHLCKVRLSRCEIDDQDVSLSKFLGAVGNDDLIDYFRVELPGESDEKDIQSAIISALSPKRRMHLEEAAIPAEQMKQSHFKKFAPVYYCRRMKQEGSKGNRAVGWFAGAITVRYVSDGNPRRFIQIMNAMVEHARKTDLTPKEQHRVLADYCSRVHSSSEGLPEYGTMTKALLDGIGTALEARVHGSHMVNGGCEFILGAGLADRSVIRKALELAAAYSLVVFSEQILCEGLKERDEARLSYLYAVTHWLPMRRGDAFVVGSKQGQSLLDLKPADKEGSSISPRQAKVIVDQMMLEAIDAKSDSKT